MSIKRVIKLLTTNIYCTSSQATASTRGGGGSVNTHRQELNGTMRLYYVSYMHMQYKSDAHKLSLIPAVTIP